MWTGAGLYDRSDHRLIDWRYHPLIHTCLGLNLAQDTVVWRHNYYQDTTTKWAVSNEMQHRGVEKKTPTDPMPMWVRQKEIYQGESTMLTPRIQ